MKFAKRKPFPTVGAAFLCLKNTSAVRLFAMERFLKVVSNRIFDARPGAFG